MENEMKVKLLHKIQDFEKKGFKTITPNYTESLEGILFEYTHLQKMYEDKVIETYNHIVKYWKEEYFNS